MARKAAEKPPEEIMLDWKREQASLKARVVDRDTEAWQRDPAFSGLQRVGGVDVSFVKDDSGSACASLVVLSYPELEVLYEDCRMVTLTAPYVSGFLAFRELPFLVDAVQRLRQREPHLMPQVLFVDGNGVLHHRGFGVACHLGVLTDLPCIGVAKKLLQVDGLENNALHKEKIQLLKAGGDSFPLMGGSGTVLGRALRSHDHSTKPLYVSVGHKISLEAAVRLTHSCCKFRIPEPVRQEQGGTKAKGVPPRSLRRACRHLQGDSCRREGLSQVLISSPPQMSTLARLSSHLCFHCPPSPGTEKNTCSSQLGVHREPHLTSPSLAGPGPSAHSPQALGCCGFGTCTSVPAASDSLVLAVPLLPRVCVLRGSEHLFDPVGGLRVRSHVESVPAGAQSFPGE
ncbi:endonuclease V isoform X1 [Moschus berezovskii]|uniref:endonuclease V isoform X1 n=2 Tax=Moschus berezovskii TaxID=68408 RepID=UPI002443AC51|nr:endonuclease V isoform X1 [Moschus berezovskii]